MDPHTGVLPGLKVMVDRAARWKFSWQQSPLAACPQEVKDGVKDGTKVSSARAAARSRRRQSWRNPGPRRVGQVGVVESRVHRTVPLARVTALSRQTSTFQTPSKMCYDSGPKLVCPRRPSMTSWSWFEVCPISMCLRDGRRNILTDSLKQHC